MNILILGGTVFVGRHLTRAALRRGHTITLFNRGQHNPDLFPDVEKLQGDRDGNLEPLRGRAWDAVIDTCGYVPRLVRASADLLHEHVPHYTFVSTISVYADDAHPDIGESYPVATLEDETVEEVTGETYGGLKALCERAVQETYGSGALILRPGLIVGPDDPTDRFTYWPHRVAQGDEVLVPGRPERGIMFIDVRDLAEWTIRMVEARAAGIFNASGPAQPLPIQALLQTARQVSGSRARFTWVSEDFLTEQGVEPWVQMPLWVPEAEHPGFFSHSVQRAVDAGLTFRPLTDTVRATLDWEGTRPPDHPWHAGISRERERKLLDAWHAQAGATTSTQQQNPAGA